MNKQRCPYCQHKKTIGHGKGRRKCKGCSRTFKIELTDDGWLAVVRRPKSKSEVDGNYLAKLKADPERYRAYRAKQTEAQRVRRKIKQQTNLGIE